jgi:hypothetical protein
MKSNHPLPENIPAPKTVVPFGNFQGNGSEPPPPPPGSRRKTAAEVFADMEKLRAEQETPLIETVEHLVNVAVRKPKSGEFIRRNPAPEMSLQVTIYEDRDDQVVYFVVPEMRPLLGEQLRSVMLATCINQAGMVFLWPIRLPGEIGATRAWAESALRAATLATTKWVRLIGEIKAGAYRVFSAQGELPEPIWPERTLQDYLVVAFEGRIIDDPQHDVILRLRGLK